MDDWQQDLAERKARGARVDSLAAAEELVRDSRQRVDGWLLVPMHLHEIEHEIFARLAVVTRKDASAGLECIRRLVVPEALRADGDHFTDWMKPDLFRMGELAGALPHFDVPGSMAWGLRWSMERTAEWHHMVYRAAECLMPRQLETWCADRPEVAAVLPRIRETAEHRGGERAYRLLLRARDIVGVVRIRSGATRPAPELGGEPVATLVARFPASVRRQWPAELPPSSDCAAPQRTARGRRGAVQLSAAGRRRPRRW